MLWADDQDDMTLHTHIREDSFSLGIVHNRDQAQGPIFSNPTHLVCWDKIAQNFIQSKYGQQLLGAFDKRNTNTFNYHKLWCPVLKFWYEMLKMSERCEMLHTQNTYTMAVADATVMTTK